MKTENIEAIFADYLKSANAPYAILINGPWGSGKTFFWKSRLVEIAHSSGFKTIYVSLNGLGKIEVLEQQIFIKLLPFIGDKDNKTAKNIITIASNAISAVSKFALKSDLKDLFKGASIDLFDFSKYVICFDDLERSYHCS